MNAPASDRHRSTIRPDPQDTRRPERDAGIVTGIAAEGRVLLRSLPAMGSGISYDRLDARLACAGVDSSRARACAERLLSNGATALVSFGISGGLDPSLHPGALILPQAVLTPGQGEIAVDSYWRERIATLFAGSGGRPHGGLMRGSSSVILRPPEKIADFKASGARAVDMESHAIAEVAQQAGVPFVVVRAIADPADRSLPAMVIGSMAANGEPRHGLIAARLALRPWHLSDLLRLRHDARQALATLGSLARAVGPVLLGRL